MTVFSARNIRVAFAAVAISSLAVLTACGGGPSGGGNNNGGHPTTPAVTSVIVSPTHAEMSAAGTAATTQQFTATVTVTGGAATTVTWSVGGIVGGNAAFGTITTTGVYTPPPNFLNPSMVTATSTVDSTKQGTALVTVTDLAGVTTFHNNSARDGSNTQEYALTTADVNTAKVWQTFLLPSRWRSLHATLVGTKRQHRGQSPQCNFRRNPARQRLRI